MQCDFYYPFDSKNGDRKVAAMTERRFLAAMFSDGVIGVDSFTVSKTGATSFSVGAGVAIVCGTVCGTFSAKTVVASPAQGTPLYIVLRADTRSSVRACSIEVTDAPKTSTTITQIANGDYRDTPIAKIESNGTANYATDARSFSTSYDATVYQQEFAQLVDAVKTEGGAHIDALSQNFQAAIDAANAENAGTYGAAGRQGFANPCFEINQRGAATYELTSGATYTVDRWLARIVGAPTSGAVVIGRAVDGARTALTVANKKFANVGKIGASCISQAIEGGVRRFCAGGKKFTVSFDAKCSKAGGAVAVEPVQYAGGGGLSPALAAQRVELSTDWKRYSLTFTGTKGPATVNGDDMLKVAFFFGWLGHHSRFGDDNDIEATYYFANMQVNEGTKALPCYVRDYGEELERCQRYYARLGFTSLSCGAVNSATKQVITCPIPITRRMRKAPTITTTDRAGVQGFASAETAAGSWRNGLTVATSDNAKEAPVLIVTNTDNAAITRVCCDSIVLDAEYYE